MNYIVFDLEWNQNPAGKKSRNDKLPFEIIEIGAVKVNSRKEITDSFHRLIKPQVYKWIHDSIHEVIHVDYKDLMKGVPFEQAVREFLDWCGEDWYFFTWGNQDVMELQRNMKFYGMLDQLPGPVTYYDVQKLYSISYDDGERRCALEHAIEKYGADQKLVIPVLNGDADRLLKRLTGDALVPMERCYHGTYIFDYEWETDTE